MRRLLPVALTALAILGLARPADAQRAQPGWIGISYEVRSARAGGSPRVVITEVRRGSPAEAVGVRAGDRLISINDISRADELANLPTRLRLQAGQPVQMRLEREGRRLDFRLRAAERPTELYSDATFSLSIQADSMVETMFRAMDSLRVHLVQASDRRGDRFEAPSPPSAPSSSRLGVANPGGRDAVSAPFEFFVFRGEQHDSLLQELEALNRQMEQLRRSETERLQELRRSQRGQRAEDRDLRLSALRGAIEDLTRESAELRGAMADEARTTAGVEYLLPSDRDPAPLPPAPRSEPYRPLTPYLLGSNRVAGAQVIEVQPELGAYFGVERGVLVVDVSPGTPAAIAGLRPGDVVTRLDQVGVRTVEDLRYGVSQAGDTLPVTLIRQGSSLQVLLRRR